MAATTDATGNLVIVTPVDVFSYFRDSWVSDFEVVAIDPHGRYALRRHIDCAVLPGTFDDEALRPSRPSVIVEV
jgi:hypothetical protein